MQQTSQRPLGITILAVLAAIGGLFGLLGGVLLLGAGGVLGSGLALVFGLITIALAVANLAFAYGAWTLKPWAWMLGIGLQALSIVWAIVVGIANNNLGGQIIGIIISAIIIYYLMTPDVKRAFGQA